MPVLYNEIEPFAAQWLRNLSTAGHIAEGAVDERSIRELRPDDIRHATQFHTFAGIGVWSYALRLAGWPDDVPVWTGSCPCQPFSGAGKRGGFSDERHLWPDWFRLIRECRPPVVFGEQVAGPDGYRWLDLVQTDLEGSGYAFGAAVLPAAGVGAPHIRHRIYWVAYSHESGLSVIRRAGLLDRERQAQRHDADGCATRGAGNADREHARRYTGAGAGPEGGTRLRTVGDLPGAPGPVGGVGDASGCGRCESRLHTPSRDLSSAGRENLERCDAGPTRGFWSRADWIPCRDGYSRPVEPAHVKMVDGATRFVGYLCSRKYEAEEVTHATRCSDPREALQTLWREARAKALRESAGGLGFVQEAQVLQPSLHGSLNDREYQGAERAELPQAVGKDCGGEVLDMRTRLVAPIGSPCRWQPDEQLSAELADVVRFLSPSHALAELYGDGPTANALRVLRETILSLGHVQHAPDSVEAAWASLGEEGQAWLAVGFDPRDWVIVRPHPLANGAPARVGRLKAYGNAIVAPVAAAFIRAVMESFDARP